jgi:microcompartment protein CcmK/EutM
MFIATVLGSVVSTIKHSAYDGTKLMVVKPVDPDGSSNEPDVLAVDTVGAGEGETVLVLRQGAAAAQVLGVDLPPVRSVIVGIVDTVSMTGTVSMHDTVDTTGTIDTVDTPSV